MDGSGAEPTEFMVVYDYGSGGVWAVIRSPSHEQIEAEFPALTVFDAPPPWMSQQAVADIRREGVYSLDERLPDWLEGLRGSPPLASR